MSKYVSKYVCMYVYLIIVMALYYQLREHAIKDILSSTGITMLSSTNGFTPLCTCDFTMSTRHL